MTSLDGSGHSDLLADLTTVASRRLLQIRSELDRLQSEQRNLEARIAILQREQTQLMNLINTYREDVDTGTRDEPHLFGARARADDVVDLLATAGTPMHYREIERELRQRGFETGAGQDPANALLATYFNDPRLERVSSGTYRVCDKGVRAQVGSHIGSSSSTAYPDSSGRRAAISAHRSRGRSENTDRILARAGVIEPGTRITVDPQKLPLISSADAAAFRARFANDRKSVIWDHDGREYAISALSMKLAQDYGVACNPNSENGFRVWCLEETPHETLEERRKRVESNH